MMIPPEQVPSKYPEEVWTRSAASTELSKLKYHTDRSCSRLRADVRAGGRTIFRRRRAALPAATKECQYCDSDSGTGTNKGESISTLAKDLKGSEDPRQVLVDAD